MATAARRSIIKAATVEAVAEAAPADQILVTVPKAFTLTDDLGVSHPYKIGTYKMDAGHSEHWFSKAHGVEVA